MGEGKQITCTEREKLSEKGKIAQRRMVRKKLMKFKKGNGNNGLQKNNYNEGKNLHLSVLLYSICILAIH